MKFDVVSFGSAVVDVFVETKQTGEKFIYNVGSKILIKNLNFDIGGGATNTAVAFSRLGLKTGCICKIGDDNNGQDILDMLNKEGVKFLGERVKGKTGYSVILDSKDKNRTILTFKGLGNDIKISNVKKFKTNWLYFSSVLGESLKTQEKIAKRLKREGTKLAFNPSEYLIRKLDIYEFLKMADVVILNREEFDLVKKKYKKSLIDICSGVVVITNKNKLVWAYDGVKKYSIKPNNIKVVERTGAGDAFASGFVAGIIVGKTISESLKLGLKESESVIRYFGAKNNLLRMKLK